MKKVLNISGYILLLLTFISTCVAADKTHVLTIEGNRFKLDGKAFDMWGIRVASASQSQKVTDHLIQQLDTYKAHGVNTVAVYYMGSSGGNSDPFTPDGRSVDPEHQNRMNQIIEACDARGMVAVVGIFYQMKPVQGVMNPVHLRNWDACTEAIRTVTRNLKHHKNIIINIANEQNTGGHKNFPWKPVRQPEVIIECCRIVKKTDPHRLVGGGGYDHDHNKIIGASPDVDVLLFDTIGPDRNKHSGYYHDEFVKAGVKNKPIVNVEIFGGWTKRFIPQGVYPTEAKQHHFTEIDDARSRPGLSVFLHSNPWCQGPSLGFPTRYNLAGMGTPDTPGIHWYFDDVQQKRKRLPSHPD